MYDKLEVDVPFLGDVFRYDSKMKSLLDNDISMSTVSTSMQNYNEFLEKYLKYRNELGESVPKSELDEQLILAYESNHHAMKELLSKSSERYKNAQELIDNIKEKNDNTSATLEILTNEEDGMIQKIETEIEDKKEEKTLENRKLEISTYYAKKYEKQQTILQNIVIILGAILMFSLMFKMNMFNETMFVFIIGTIFSLLVIYIVMELWDISMRDATIFDEYDFGNMSTANKGKQKRNDIPNHSLSGIKPLYCKTKK
jgi:hypothetical protein